MRKELFFILIIFLLFCGCFNHKEEYVGKVVKVVDGDTVYVEVNGKLWKIRLLGVDCPEIHKKNNPHEYRIDGHYITNITYLYIWGLKAKEFAEKELDHHKVIIVFDPEAPKKDRYGRYLAYIYINKSGRLVNFNEELLKYGYARVYISKFSLLDEFLRLEKEAKKERRGMWNYENT
ncbi:calcium-activated nuclease EcnA [Methanocaldococcus sp.]